MRPSYRHMLYLSAVVSLATAILVCVVTTPRGMPATLVAHAPGVAPRSLHTSTKASIPAQNPLGQRSFSQTKPSTLPKIPSADEPDSPPTLISSPELRKGGEITPQGETVREGSGRRRRGFMQGGLAALAAAVVYEVALGGADPAEAAMVEAQKEGPAESASEKSKDVVSCLFAQCRGELFGCLENPVCAANLVCLSQCTGRPDEIDCQVKCGDLFQTSAIDKFNDCAISRGGCVPQRADENLYPVPETSALVSSFDMSKFTGDWYITLGENPLFDTFDCQLHKFSYDSKTAMLSGDLTWRVKTPDEGFITRATTQTFRQDAANPALLINDGNEFLHYSDNWYIASSQLEGTATDHVLVYYRGSNDAWDGYGGVVLYTRQPVMPAELAPVIKTSCAKLPRVKYSDLRATNNLCLAEAPLIPRVERKIAKDTQTVVEALEKEEELVFDSIEEKILALEGEYYKDKAAGDIVGQEVVNDLAFFLKGVQRDIKAEERLIEGYTKKLVKAFVDGEKRFIEKESNFLSKVSRQLFRQFSKQEKKVLEELEMDVKDVENLLAGTFGSSTAAFAKRTSKVLDVASAE